MSLTAAARLPLPRRRPSLSPGTKPKPVPAVFKPIPTIAPDVPVSSSVVMADHEVPSTPTKRGYRRRDMTADE